MTNFGKTPFQSGAAQREWKISVKSLRIPL